MLLYDNVNPRSPYMEIPSMYYISVDSYCKLFLFTIYMYNFTRQTLLVFFKTDRHVIQNSMSFCQIKICVFVTSTSIATDSVYQ